MPVNKSPPKKSSKALKRKAEELLDSSRPSKSSKEQSIDSENESEANEKGQDGDYLHGFSTDDDDSSDEDNVADDSAAIDAEKLPTVAKDDASVKRRLEKAKKQQTEERGVLFLGRLPHGFYEDQLRAYFSQFGTVTRLRVSRNKRTGKSKHYGFIEFESLAVAQIVAETMDNYLLTGHILRCKLIPNDQVHPELWIGSNRKWRPIPRNRIQQQAQNSMRTVEDQVKATKRLLKRQDERKRKLENAGIKYDFSAVEYKPPPVAAS